MKRFTRRALVLSLPFAAFGCNTFPWSKNNTNTSAVNNESNAVFAKREPSAQELVAYQNDNARKVQAVQANIVTMDCKSGSESAIGLDAKIACARPKNFRLTGTIVNQPQVDIGSNDEELWYWIGKADPRLFHCSYKDMNTGQVRLPFPFNPEMVVCALNMAEYNPNAAYTARVRDNVIELIEPTKSMQGQDIFKVTYFNRGNVSAERPRVFAYALKDKQGKDICTATMLEVQTNKETGAVLPTRVKIIFYGEKPADRGEMIMKFYDLKPMRFDADQTSGLFSRKYLAHLQGFDLASGKLDQPSGTSMSIQRTGGVLPR